MHIGLALALTAPRQVLSDGGGGGDAPAWVQALAAPSGDLPTDALLFSDGAVKLDQYWSAEAEQDVADLLTAVEHFTFAPSDITAPGLLIEDGNTVRVAAKGPLLTSLCSVREQTLVFEVELTTVPGISGDGVLCIGFSPSVEFGVQPVPLQIDWYPSGGAGNIAWEATNGVEGSFDTAAEGVGNAVWKVALSIKDNSDVISSFNGAAAHNDVASEPDLGLPTVWRFGSNDVDGLEFPNGVKPLDGYIRSIVRYPLQPDAALPTLSA